MYRPKKVFFSRQRMVFRVIIGPFQLEISEKILFLEYSWGQALWVTMGGQGILLPHKATKW